MEGALACLPGQWHWLDEETLAGIVRKDFRQVHDK